MPKNNGFEHQQYPTEPSVPPEFVHLAHTSADDVDFSGLHTSLNTSDVIVVHGTFVGDDPFAVADILRSLGEGSRLLKPTLAALAKHMEARTPVATQSLTGDVGNYTDEYVDAFQQLVGEDPVVARLDPTWSGQNHHFARADLAVRLLCRIADIDPGPDRTILLWGHSHAGNGFALLSNLMANNPVKVKAFIEAVGQPLPQHWRRAASLLASHQGPVPWAQHINIVAFGTPVRYGWDSDGYRSLIHVLHYIPQSTARSITAHPVFPLQSPAEVVTARHGDWIQAFGIAGTDVVPPTARQENARLDQLLQSSLQPPHHGIDTRLIPTERLRSACARWKTGTRCHADGKNILVTYEPCGRLTALNRPIEVALLGHGVATTIDWLPAHLGLVLQLLSNDSRMPK